MKSYDERFLHIDLLKLKQHHKGSLARTKWSNSLMLQKNERIEISHLDCLKFLPNSENAVWHCRDERRCPLCLLVPVDFFQWVVVIVLVVHGRGPTKSSRQPTASHNTWFLSGPTKHIASSSLAPIQIVKRIFLLGHISWIWSIFNNPKLTALEMARFDCVPQMKIRSSNESIASTRVAPERWAIFWDQPS